MVSIAEDWNINYLTKQIYHDQWKDEITGSSTSVAEEADVVCRADSAGDLNNKYFILYSGQDQRKYHVWYNVNSGGTDPAPTGSTGIEVAVATGAANTAVATATASAIAAANGTLDFSTSVATATVTITNKKKGSTTDVADFNVGGASSYTVTTQGVGETKQSVNALYSWLQDTFDELGQMDDEVPMSAQTPTEYSLINGWFIDEVSIKYLKGGAISSSGWDWVENTNAGIVQVEYDSGTPVASDIGLPVVLETDGDTGTCMFIDTTRSKVWIRPTDSTLGNSFDSTAGYNIDFTGGTQDISLTTAAALSGENVWANMYTLGTIEDNTAIYVVQDGTKTSAWWEVGHMDVLIRVQEMGSTTGPNSGSLGTIFIGARQYSKLFDHFVSTGITGGRNPVPLATGVDLNNNTGQYQIILSGSSGTFSVGERFEVAATPGKQGTITAVSGSNPTVTLQYYLSGTSRTQFADTNVIAEIGAGDGAGTINGAPTELVAGYGSGGSPITMTFGNTSQDLNNGNGTQPYDVIINTGGKTVAQMYEWLKFVTMRGYTSTPTQLKTGTASTPYVPASDTADTNIDGEQYIYLLDNFTPVKASPFGTFAGGKFFGARGVWITGYPATDAQNFQLIDADGDTQVPPNTVSVTVNSVVANDVVGVFVLDTSTSQVDKDTYTTGVVALGAGTIGVLAQINPETPQAGVLRVVDQSASAKTEYQYEYESWSDTVFTLHTVFSAGSPGDIDTAGTTTILNHQNITTDHPSNYNFIQARVRAGDKVTNATTTSTATVVSISSDQIITTASDTDWRSGDEYYIETVTDIALESGSDNLYVPIINEVVTQGQTSVSNTLIKNTSYTGIPVIIRVRQGKVILPFSIANTVGSTGMTQAAIRTADTIAT